MSDIIKNAYPIAISTKLNERERYSDRSFVFALYKNIAAVIKIAENLIELKIGENPESKVPVDVTRKVFSGVIEAMIVAEAKSVRKFRRTDCLCEDSLKIAAKTKLIVTNARPKSKIFPKNKSEFEKVCQSPNVIEIKRVLSQRIPIMNALKNEISGETCLPKNLFSKTNEKSAVSKRTIQEIIVAGKLFGTNGNRFKKFGILIEAGGGKTESTAIFIKKSENEMIIENTHKNPKNSIGLFFNFAVIF